MATFKAPGNGEYYIAIDIGGTFTDCVILEKNRNQLTMAKASTTPGKESAGVLAALQVGAGDLGMSLQELLGSTVLFTLGTTALTNALIERKGVPTVLLTTRGFEDEVIVGRCYQHRAGMPESYVVHESAHEKPDPPVIDQRYIAGIPERIDYEGKVVVPLNVPVLLATVERFVKRGVKSFAICFLWSFLNPVHERQAKQAILEAHPELFVSASHEIAPLIGNYERALTVVLNTYLGPVADNVTRELHSILAQNGFRGQFFLMHAGGGTISSNEAAKLPILLLDSGPVGGTLGSCALGRVLNEPNIICTDMGGTSFDVSIIKDSRPNLNDTPTCDKYTFFMPKVEINSIGAGGGSIIWLDPAGVLKVGPESAGAVPGPACYGTGGSRPTVTDANVLLGYVNPDNFLGGRMQLYKEKAEKAFEPLARALSMTPLEVAAGAFSIVNAQMADLVRRYSIEMGYDPRNFVLLCYGGATATHAAYFARQLLVRSAVIPPEAPVFSAFGMLGCDVLHSLEKSVLLEYPADKNKIKAAVTSVTNELRDEVVKRFEAEGIAGNQVALEKSAYMRYTKQVHSLSIPLADGDQGTTFAENMIRLFQRRYEEIFGKGSGYARAGIEFEKCKVEGRWRPPIPQKIRQPKKQRSSIKPKEVRDIFLDRNWVKAGIYDSSQLGAGDVLAGPCIVERPSDTVLIPAFASGAVDEFLNIILTWSK